jgi:hypothetical protein
VELPLGIFEEITGLGNLPPPVDQADHDRRKNQRAPFGFRGTITHEKKGEQVSSVVMVRDISIGGLSFLNEETLKPGTLFVMEFKGVDDRPVQIRCSVQRCATGGLEETEHIVGATFEELLTKELERPKPPPVAAQPASLDPDIQAALGEDAAAHMIEGDDLTAKAPGGQPADPAKSEPAQSADTPAAGPAPAAAANADPGAPAPADAAAPAPAALSPAPNKSSLFSSAPIAKPKRGADDLPSEDEVGKPKAAPKPAPSDETGPVFRDVPMPGPAPAPAKPQREEESFSTSASSENISSPESFHLPVGGGKTHEILARVKELLLRQEHTIKSQAEQLRDQRDNASKEMEMLRAEVAEMKNQITELRARTQADDQAISELANFLQEHATAPGDQRESEAA